MLLSAVRLNRPTTCVLAFFPTCRNHFFRFLQELILSHIFFLHYTLRYATFLDNFLTAKCPILHYNVTPPTKQCPRIPLLGIIMFCVVSTTLAQRNHSLDDRRLAKVRDSLDRLIVITPRASASLVRLGQVELYSSSTVASADFMYDKQGNNANFSGRALGFNSFLQVNAGITKNRRINIGLEGLFQMFRQDYEGSDNMFSILNGDSTTINSFTYAGVRVRLQPLKRVFNFTWQSYLWLPIASVDKQKQLRTYKYNWGNTLYYYWYFTPDFGIIANAGGLALIPSSVTVDYLGEEEKKTEFLYNAGLTLSWIPIRKNILFGTVTYARSNKDIATLFEGADSDFLELRAGYQRTINKRFSFNVSYATIALAHNYSKWQQVNFGLRYVL